MTNMKLSAFQAFLYNVELRLRGFRLSLESDMNRL